MRPALRPTQLEQIGVFDPHGLLSRVFVLMEEICGQTPFAS